MPSDYLTRNSGGFYLPQAQIQATGTTIINYAGAQPVTTLIPSVALPEPEKGPLDWLRDQVGEICELARAA